MAWRLRSVGSHAVDDEGPSHHEATSSLRIQQIPQAPPAPVQPAPTGICYASGTASNWHSRSTFFLTDVDPSSSSITCTLPNGSNPGPSFCATPVSPIIEPVCEELTQWVTPNADNLTATARPIRTTEEPTIFVTRAKVEALVRQEKERTSSATAYLTLRPHIGFDS